MRGKASQLIREKNQIAWLAHTSAVLQRSQRMPPLSKLLVGERDQKPQTWQEMKARTAQWVLSMGGEVRSKDK